MGPSRIPLTLKVKEPAILGTLDLDVEEIEVTSLRLAGVAPIRSASEGLGRPEDAEDGYDYNPDGWADLTVRFNTQEIVDALGDVGGGDEEVLTGPEI